MKASAQILKVENVTGNATKTGKPYDLDFLTFIDFDSFDKIKVLLSKEQAAALIPLAGKKGIVTLGHDAKTERLTFQSFAAA